MDYDETIFTKHVQLARDGGMIPQFFYYLADYDERPIMTFAPIAVGDILHVREQLNEGTERKKVIRIEHLEIDQLVGSGILSAFVYLED